jgi:copper transport protein
MRNRTRRLRRLFAIPVVAGIVLILTATAASAHAVLESTNPSPNTNVATSPKAVTLTFSEHVDVRSDAIRLFDSSLSAIDIGSTKHVAGKGDEVTASLPKLKKGLYTVAWRAISADSHPVQGAFTFGVQTSATGSAATKLAAQAQATEKSDATVGVLLGVTRFGVFVGLALLIGIVGFVLFLWPSGRVSVRVRQVLYAGLWITFVSTVLGFMLQGPYTSGGGVGDMFSTDLMQTTWDTRFGKVYVLRLVLLLVMAVLVRMIVRTGREAPSRALVAMATLVAVALAATPGLAGHASTGRWSALALVADVLHVLAMAVWIGGLVALGLARHDDVAYPTVAHRFSGVALGAVVVIVLSGSFQAIRQLQPFSSLWDSDYGTVLLLKIGAFLVVIGIAAWSRRLVHGRGMGFARAGASPAVAVREPVGVAPGSGVGTMVRDDEPAPLPEVHPGLTRSVRAELVFAAVVLALTSVLVNTSPPHTTVGATEINTVIGTGATRFETYFGPTDAKRPNDLTLHVTAVGSNGLPKKVVDMNAELANPTKDVPPITVPLKKFPGATGHYIAEGIQVPAGRWVLTVKAYPTELDVVTATADITVG